MNHHFSPHLVHSHSKQWYDTTDLSELYSIWHPITNKLYSVNCLFIYLFIYSNLFPYIPFRYIPWEWKELFCGVPKALFLVGDFFFLSHRKKIYSPSLTVLPPVHPLNLIYSSLIPWHLFYFNLTCTDKLHSMYQISYPFSVGEVVPKFWIQIPKKILAS